MIHLNSNMWYLLILTFWFSTASCKVFKRCELADVLREQGEDDEERLNTWVCIAKYESRFDTTATNFYSGDHGVFQISELFWCSKWGEDKVCHMSCDKLKDDDITDDFRCAKKIYKEHQRLQGDGFKAWVVYETHCSNGRSKGYLDDCQNNHTTPSETSTTPQQATSGETSTTPHTTSSESSTTPILE